MIKLYWLKITINNKYIFMNINKYKYNKNLILNIYNKNLYIYKKLLNLYIKVYNGYKFIPIYINKTKLFNKLGNFIYTKFVKNNIKELLIN
ncbi:apicoplast ribosomal protein S19, putative [Plasmodium reichenowi]|uniref:Apicoplast ribosomal protein S19, putative n=1 Tax=Plasmodium reichenowi TaxID=5854 RepID=A0A060S6H7_PLARE|nr:apicoplast ribosomal protein S19, putative [Plasmodium reichenowi]KYO03640.1 apicoplast ribosomal protein S19, putative [Plasmodium reichenowi]CDO67256.1 apicoplast ribosomal protein S19, putative [Plasmodium reichenowi]